MKIYVVTNPELGWDNVIDVCTDKQYAEDTYPNMVITATILNERKIKKEKLSIKTFDENTMSCFADGEIGAGEYDGKIPQNEIKRFVKCVESFGNENLEVVYHNKYKYHFVAYLGIADANWDYQSKEMDKLFNNLQDHFSNNNIQFG